MLLRIPQEAVRVKVAARKVAPGVRLHLNLQASRTLKGIWFSGVSVPTPKGCLRHMVGHWGPRICGAVFVAIKVQQNATEHEIARQLLGGPREVAEL